MDTNAESRLDSTLSTQEANSAIADEFLGLCEASDKDKTKVYRGSEPKHSLKSRCESKFAVKIGIVIPIYNVAPYLVECLDSVLNQTYKNFYAVLVNDGSTDDSKQIALEFVAKDSRFVLIDKENGGLSSARNAGINYFNGGNSVLGMQFRTCENFRTSTDSSLVESPKIFTNTKATPQSLPLRFCESQNLGENSEKIAESSLDSATIHTHKNTAPNPPKIDYIIFLDSDDFWEANLLQTCVDSAKSQNLDIIWFGWKTFYENAESINITNGGGRRDNPNANNSSTNILNTHNPNSNNPTAQPAREYKKAFTWIWHYKYEAQVIISGIDVLNRAKERSIPLLANAWDIFINWQFLQNIKLDFLEGVVWEDVLFAELLFAQCERILVLPQDLSNYRVRVDSTQNFAKFKQKVLPPFVAPLQKYFSDANSAWAYFSAFSWVSIAEQFSRFCETHKNTQITAMLKECYLAHLLVEGSAIMECENDPNGAKKVFLKLAVKWGKKYLPPKKRHFLYKEGSLVRRIYKICAYLAEKKRKFRQWRKSLFEKE